MKHINLYPIFKIQVSKKPEENNAKVSVCVYDF